MKFIFPRSVSFFKPATFRSANQFVEVAVVNPETLRSKPVVVVVFPYRLLPATNGGARRVLNMVGCLRQHGYAVILVQFATHGLSELEQVTDGYVRLDPPPLKSTEGQNPLLARFQSAADAAVLALYNYYRPVAVIGSFTTGAFALRAVRNAATLKVADVHDVEHHRSDVFADAGVDLEHRRCSADDEVEALQHADIIMSLTPEDGKIYEELLPRARHVVCPHGSEVVPLARNEAGASPCFGFIGNAYEPNTNGITRFIECNWRKIRAAIPDATLIIAGLVTTKLDSALLKIAQHDGIQTYSYIEDLHDFYRSIDVALAPIEFGTGQKIKVIEAMCLGRPVCGTPHAFGGMGDDVPGIIKPIEDMGEELIDLVTKPDGISALTQESIAYARSKFAIDVQMGPLLDAIAQFSASRGDREPELLACTPQTSAGKVA